MTVGSNIMMCKHKPTLGKYLIPPGCHCATVSEPKKVLFSILLDKTLTGTEKRFFRSNNPRYQIY